MKIKLTEGLSLPSVGPISDSAYRREKLDEALLQVRSYSSAQDVHNNYSVVGAYSSMYQRIAATQQQIIRDVDEVNHYIVHTILCQLTEDALSPEIGTGQIFTINYPTNPKIEKILKKLEKDLNLDALVTNIIPDVLKYGEYVLETVVDDGDEFEDELNPPFDTTAMRKKLRRKSKGLVAVRDVVEQGTVVTITQDTEVTGYLALTPDKRQIVKRAPERYVKFVLNGARKRIKLEELVPQMMTTNKKVQEILKTLPRFVRIGQSVIHPFISKIRELDLLEKLVPATKLSKLSNVNLVGVQVPSKFNLNDGFEAARRMEDYVNNKVGIDARLGEITVESILSVAGRTKVLPLFGDKGTVEKIDYESSEPDEMLSSVKDLREVILDSMGIPYELFYKSDSGSKAETLKRYAKYLRKLKNIQRTVADGIKDICRIHLDALDLDYELDKIEIEHRNKLIEIDNLDKLEHADITISFLNNITNFFNDISAETHPLSESVNLDAVAAFIDRNLKTIGLADAINTKDETGKSLNKPKIVPAPEPEPTVEEPTTEEPVPEPEAEVETEVTSEPQGEE
jgi:hypothetical protein